MGSPKSGGVSKAAHVVLTVDAADFDLAADALRQSGARAIEERHVGNAIELWAVLGDSAASSAFVDRWRDRWQADPEESFGLGDHPTTRVVADILCRLMAPESSVLDMGSGSGVLSIVAALLGARRVVGIDRAIGAVGVAQRNAERNGVSEVTEFFQGSTVPNGEQFDVVAANILAPVLLELCDPIVRSVEPGGTIILSGLHIDRRQDVINRYTAEGCRLVEDLVLEGWCGVAMTKQQ
ncbi:MAG: methyltransferase domain-containing protein [Actinobacteria bacterium]|nr:methyltransferase domain-containing protein [Actinomycetota bacterium]